MFFIKQTRNLRNLHQYLSVHVRPQACVFTDVAAIMCF